MEAAKAREEAKVVDNHMTGHGCPHLRIALNLASVSKRGAKEKAREQKNTRTLGTGTPA
jgi:hypothetical protein